MTVASAMADVRDRIDRACRDAGREPGEVTLMPVTKTVDADQVRAAWAAGATTVGENRVQEAQRKAAELEDVDLRWSIIGPLQTNKITKVIDVAAELQSLDRHEVASGLDRRLQQGGRSLDVYVQVNTSAEPQKSGVALEDVLDFTAGLGAYASLRVIGLMTVAVFSDDRDRVAGCFDRLAELRDRLRDRDGGGWDGLSMGMSGDFELAVARGSTVVRVGTAIFGSRG